MFGPDKKEGGKYYENSGENETIIGATVKVDGDFVSDGNVLVEGVVNGSLKTKGNLRVEKGAKIKADVEAAALVVHGEIHGNVTVKESAVLGESAVVEGDISARVLSVEPGAILCGHCSVVSPEKESAKPILAPQKKAAAKEA